MNHLMIDLETMGTLFNAPVVAIGACFFNPDTGEISDTFYETIGMASAFDNGRASGDTVKWWMTQSDEARMAVIAGTLRTEDVLDHFRKFCGDGRNLVVWGNGPTFDISILEYAFMKAAETQAPWRFYNVRDCRTIKDLVTGIGFTSQVMREGTHHQALDDAIFQAKWVSEAWQLLRNAVLNLHYSNGDNVAIDAALASQAAATDDVEDLLA